MGISFADIKIHNTYNRPELGDIWGVTSYAELSHEIVIPEKTPYIILFLTEEKLPASTQYRYHFADGIVEMDGEAGHATDQKLIDAAKNGYEIHLFHRERPRLSFSYEGKVNLIDYKIDSSKPSQFKFKTI